MPPANPEPSEHRWAECNSIVNYTTVACLVSTGFEEQASEGRSFLPGGAAMPAPAGLAWLLRTSSPAQSWSKQQRKDHSTEIAVDIPISLLYDVQ
jgi:hypothetical protein